MNPEKRTVLPSIAFSSFAKRFTRPQLSEGFQDITEVAFKVRFSHVLFMSIADARVLKYAVYRE